MKRQLILLTGFCLLVLSVNQAQAQDYLKLANDCFEKGDYECAKRYYNAQRLEAIVAGMDEKITQCDNSIAILTVANFLFSEKDYQRAKEKYEELLVLNPKDPLAKSRIELCDAELNNPDYLYQRGKTFYDAKEYSEAFECFKKAGEQGSALAQYHLGVMYRNGYGVIQNNAEATKWYIKATEQGNPEARRELEQMTPKTDEQDINVAKTEIKPPGNASISKKAEKKPDNINIDTKSLNRRSTIFYAAGGASIAVGVAATFLFSKSYTEYSNDGYRMKGKEYNMVYSAAGVIVGGACIGAGIYFKKKSNLNVVAYGNELGLRLTF